MDNRDRSASSDGAVSSRRLPFLDIARGLAVIFTIAIHTRWLYGYSGTKGTYLGDAIRFLGEAPAAPVFMFAMGISFVPAPGSSLGDAVRKGARLLGLAYLLNVLKFVVPMLVFGTLPAIFMTDARAASDLHPALFYLLLGDILQLAAIALVVIALIHHWVARYITFSLVLAVLVSAVSPWLWGKHASIPGLDYLLDLLWGNSVGFYFPVFPWLSFALLGLAVGGLIQRYAERKDTLFAVLFCTGVPLLAAGLLLTRDDPAHHWADYYRPTPSCMLFYAGFLLCWSGVCHWLGRVIAGTFVLRGLQYLSRHVTLLYMLQWTILYWGVGIIGLDAATLGETCALIVVVTALTVLMAHLLLSLKKVWAHQQDLERRMAPGALPEH